MEDNIIKVDEKVRKSNFIHVYLLPNTKKVSTVNLTIFWILLVAVVVGYFFVLAPYSKKRSELSALTEVNASLDNTSDSLQNQILGLGIDTEAAVLQANIDGVVIYEVDITALVDDLDVVIDDNNGDMVSIAYNTISECFFVTVETQNENELRQMTNAILDIAWVNSDTNFTYRGTPTKISDYTYSVDFVIGVDYDD